MTPAAFSPEWRTSAVVALCQSMRESDDYSATPILADALQEAGCGDEALLARLRSGVAEGKWDDERLVAIAFSAGTAAAVAWVDALAAEMGDSYGYDDEGDLDASPTQPMNYGVLVTAAADYVSRGDFLTQWGAENWRDVMYEGDNVQKFWDCYKAITGKSCGTSSDGMGIPRTTAPSFISCSC